jgi:hypothetical protein
LEQNKTDKAQKPSNSKRTYYLAGNLALVFNHFRGYAVAQLVKALRYKPEGRGFDSRWSHWNFSVT